MCPIPLPEVHLNIILPSTPGSSKWSLPQVSPPKPYRYLSSHPIRATCSANLILLDMITRTILGEQYGSLSSSLCSLLDSLITSSLLGQNILLRILFSNTYSQRSSSNVSDQVPHVLVRVRSECQDTFGCFLLRPHCQCLHTAVQQQQKQLRPSYVYHHVTTQQP